MIPPESLPGFQDIVLSDKRIKEDVHLRKLADKIQDAISRNKFMIHFGMYSAIQDAEMTAPSTAALR